MNWKRNSRYHQLHSLRVRCASFIVRASVQMASRGLSARRTQAVRPRFAVRWRVLELEADTRGGAHRGGVELEAVRQSILHPGVEGAEIAVEALAEAIIEHYREGILGAAAAAAGGVGATRLSAGGEAVLLVAVEGCQQVQRGAQADLRPRPEHLQGLLVFEGGVVGEGEHVAADGERAFLERRVGGIEGGALIASRDSHRAYGVGGHDSVGGVRSE